MSIVLPMVKESQTSGGAGDLTGTAAVTNFWRGDTAPGGALNRRYKYWIQDGALHEYGIGYKSAAGTFVRETVLGNSSGTTAAINFTASAVIISMETPGMVGTFPSVYSEDGDRVGMLQNTVTRFSRSTDGATANILYVMPIRWCGESGIAELGLDVLVAPTVDATVYVGFYSIGANGEPDQVLSETSFSVLTTTTGIVTGIIAAPVLFRDCFVAFVSTQDMTIRSNNNAQFTLPSGVLGSSSDTPYSMLLATVAAPTALPSPPPTSWTPKRLGVDNPSQFGMYGG